MTTELPTELRPSETNETNETNDSQLTIGLEAEMLDDLADALTEIEDVGELDEKTVDEITPHTSRVYERVFGSIDHALVELGYAPRDPDDLTPELMINALQVFALSRGEAPTRDEWIEEGPFSYMRFRDTFGSFPNARIMAGVDSLGMRVALGECVPDPDDPFKIVDRDDEGMLA